MKKIDYQFETLKTRIDGETLVLSFNRPEVLNAINYDMESAFYEALHRAEDDPRIKAILLKGEGRVFSAGHDTQQVAREMVEGTEPPTFQGRHWQRTGYMLPSWDCSKPIVAAVHGFVGPHANAILMTCDFVIAAENTRFSFEAAQKMSTGVPYGPFVLLPFYFPPRALKKIWLAGGWFDEQQARDLHYVQRVVALDDLEAEAMRHCRHMESLPHRNVRDNKKGIHQLYELWGLLQMSLPGREPYQGGGEERAILLEQMKLIYELGVGKASKLRDEDVDETVSKL